MKSKHIPIRTFLMAAGLAVAAVGVAPYALADDSNPPAAHSDSMGAAISDTDITAKVKLKYVGDKALKGSDISVNTTNGVVTLTGSAASSDAKKHAEEVAEQVKGVKSVSNELKTPSSSKLGADTKSAAHEVKTGVSDSWITTKVKSSLLADSVTKGFDIKVTTTNGVVVLSGKVPNKDAADHARDIAEKIDGVKSVNIDDLAVGA